MRRSERPLPAGAALTALNASRDGNCFFGTFSLRRLGVERVAANAATRTRGRREEANERRPRQEQDERKRPAIASPSPAARVRTPSRFAGLVVLASRPCARLRECDARGAVQCPDMEKGQPNENTEEGRRSARPLRRSDEHDRREARRRGAPLE